MLVCSHWMSCFAVPAVLRATAKWWGECDMCGGVSVDLKLHLNMYNIYRLMCILLSVVGLTMSI